MIDLNATHFDAPRACLSKSRLLLQSRFFHYRIDLFTTELISLLQSRFLYYRIGFFTAESIPLLQWLFNPSHSLNVSGLELADRWSRFGRSHMRPKHKNPYWEPRKLHRMRLPSKTSCVGVVRAPTCSNKLLQPGRFPEGFVPILRFRQPLAGFWWPARPSR